MKSFKTKTLSIVILFSSVFNYAIAQDGNITFTGDVTDSTCAISVNGGPASTSIDLGTSFVKSFPVAGTMASATDFTIALSACTAAVSNVAVTFDGTADSNDMTTFENTSTGSDASTGIGVRLYNNGTDTTLISPHGTSASYAVQDNAISLPFSARMTSTKGDVTAGLITSLTDFTVNYQ